MSFVLIFKFCSQSHNLANRNDPFSNTNSRCYGKVFGRFFFYSFLCRQPNTMGVSCIYAKQTLTIPKKVCYSLYTNSNIGMLLSTLCTVCVLWWFHKWVFFFRQKNIASIFSPFHTSNCKFHWPFPVIYWNAQNSCAVLKSSSKIKLEARFLDFGFGLHKDRTHCLTIL